jgi:predicted enzyme related to lactoylglutathione lyase
MYLEITNWITIPVEDRQRAGNFYTRVLNLPAIDFRIGNTNISYLPDAVNGGYCGSMVEKDDAGWELRPSLVYIYAFGDIDEVAGRITESGGHILSIKTNVYPEEGVFIIFEDTEANKIAFVGLRASQAQKHSA